MKIKVLKGTNKNKLRRAVPFVKWFCGWAEERYLVFELTVFFVPEGIVCHQLQPNNVGFAAYCPSLDAIACGTGAPNDEKNVLENIAHECVHVEQRLRGIPYTERGVTVRSRTLIKLWKAYRP